MTGSHEVRGSIPLSSTTSSHMRTFQQTPDGIETVTLSLFGKSTHSPLSATEVDLMVNQCPSINGLFAQYLRYTQKIILGISTIYLWLFFSRALILNKNPHLWMGTK